jgi:phenylpropionate dioxygenase-like ring-hydroxylating dioxygenase large terminal subunit
MKNNDNFFLRNIWYYALPSNHLKPGTMVSRVFLGEPVLLIRDRNGKVAAMQDICPHRGVPLSCGRFDGQEVECCYHGWRFNSGGRCTAIPSLVEEQQMDLSRFDVQSYTVREAQGNIWIYEEVKQFDASPHGFTMRRHQLPANGGRLYWLIGGGVPETEISFRLPGVRVEETTIGKHRVVNLTTVTPISDTETEVTFSLYWTLPWVGFFQPLLHVLARTFLGQDRSVVEKQQIGLKYNPVLRLIKDSDVQAQWYYQLKREYARSIAEERQFVNPVKGQILRWRA